MFTGIVQWLATVRRIDTVPFGVRLTVDAAGWPHQPHPGDSIAINGCCLTVTPPAHQDRGISPHLLTFDVIRQTLDVTTLGTLQPGDRVNLEHAVTPSSLMGGHIVQGHVDDMGEVVQRISTAEQHRIRVQPLQRTSMRCIVEKGSVAVNGVSLTVAAVSQHWFEVALIPTTLRLTNLGVLAEGSRVNLETDYIAKVVVNWLERSRQ